ncbi:hypothetical protein [Flavobacterium alkalisoli]|uniref:hypothetical protein n=1 Tax=Flavobacterium alkalisoli TaxID=2602769 RepID=UPI003A8DA317
MKISGKGKLQNIQERTTGGGCPIWEGELCFLNARGKMSKILVQAFGKLADKYKDLLKNGDELVFNDADFEVEHWTTRNGFEASKAIIKLTK